MIGVIADLVDRPAVEEFFELFKTAWQWYDPERTYAAVLSATGELPRPGATPLTIIWAGHPHETGNREQAEPEAALANGRVLQSASGDFPIYGPCTRLAPNGAHDVLLSESGSGAIYGYRWEREGQIEVRIGYNLFAEVGILLSKGQPIERAGYPTMERQIQLLRRMLVDARVPFCEIPPVPDGFRFAAALTHDVDHPSLRAHGVDHTVLGHLGRAVVGTVLEWIRGKRPFADVARNWLAAMELPFIQLGWRRDPWRRFVEYSRWEGGPGRSTFFFIPFSGRPGHRSDGSAAPAYRAAKYGAADVQREIRALQAEGQEVGLHGIDAWRDVGAAKEELAAIEQTTGRHAPAGVRMHWLYRGPEMFAVLERAGIEYDSTVGYNETVGYRAGTSQAFRPLAGVTDLLELPLVVMDTALFYPSHLNLGRNEAWRLVTDLIRDAECQGGVLTINWHDRSLFAERLWGTFYRQMINEIEARGGWIATAANCVEWFRLRRRVVFDQSTGEPLLPESRDTHLPALRIERHSFTPAEMRPRGIPAAYVLPNR